MTASDFWRRLLYRWFVQYNPLYLLSATLVLGGMILLSRGLAQAGSVHGTLAVAAIAEAYACSLIGGAALLTRIRQRRPAVMLAFITLLYQADPTLHTEACAYLGRVGVIASATWLVSFVVKLVALAWALRIRVARRAIGAAFLGALGLAVGPYVLGGLDARTSGAAVGVFVYALGCVAPRRAEDAVVSLVPLDAWGRIVIRRSVRAATILLFTLLALHVLFWSTQRSISLAAVLPALALLAVHRVRSEWRLWAAVTALVAVVTMVAPSSLSLTALLTAATLVRRVFGGVEVDDAPRRGIDASPYRARDPNDDSAFEACSRRGTAHEPSFVPVDGAARDRLLTGALFATYVAAYTSGWQGGPLPAHVLPLDLALAAVALFAAFALRRRIALVPLFAASAHAIVAAGLVPTPRSILEWGGAATALGFSLLGASLVVSYRLRHDGCASAPGPSVRASANDGCGDIESVRSGLA